MNKVSSEYSDRGLKLSIIPTSPTSSKEDRQHDNDVENLREVTRKEERSNDGKRPSEMLIVEASNQVLMDSSAKYANDTQQREAKDGHDTTKLPHLRIFKATGRSGANLVKQRLPKEVFIQSQGSDCEPGAGTVFSELGVEGLLSAGPMDRRFPQMFTFDVVPSKSSMDGSETPVDTVMLSRTPNFKDMRGVPELLHDLDYEIDDLSEPSPRPHAGDGHDSKTNEEIVQFDPIMAARSGVSEEMIGISKLLDGLDCELDHFSKTSSGPQLHHRHDGHEGLENRERCRTESTEVSIEFTESKFWRSADVDEKYNIFSPRNSFSADPVDHGFDVVQSANAPKGNRNEESFLPWLNLGFLSLW